VELDLRDCIELGSMAKPPKLLVTEAVRAVMSIVAGDESRLRQRCLRPLSVTLASLCNVALTSLDGMVKSNLERADSASVCP
jgi:hypothetical protein